MTRRGGMYFLVVAALISLGMSGTVHPYIAPLCLGWLGIQHLVLDRNGLRVPEGAAAMLYVWLGIVFLWFALIGRRGTNTDMLELMLGFGAPFLVLKIVGPESRSNDAVTVVGSIVLALGSMATAPGLLPVAILAIFLLAACLGLPAVVRRDPEAEDSVSVRVVASPAGWKWAPAVAGLILTVLGLFLGGLLYLLVPRMAPDASERIDQKALDIQARSARRTLVSGIATTLKMGDIGQIKRDDRVAFEAQLRYHGRPFNVPRSRRAMLLLRLRAWDTYDPETSEWRRRLGKLKQIGRNGVLRKGESTANWPVDWSIRPVGYGGRRVLLPQRAGRVRTPGVRLLRGPAGSVVAEAPLREYGVEAGDPVTSRVDFARLEAAPPTPELVHVPASLEAQLRRYLPRPASYRVWDKITSIQRFFTQNDFRYTLQLPPSLPKDVDPLLAFLDRREGHCELYAATACLMLRLYGIPARVAGGMRMIRNMDAEGKGRYRARFRNAHAWVEILCRDVDWVAIDFTPPDGRAVTPTGVAEGESNENEAALNIDGRGEATPEAAALFDWSNPFSFNREDQTRFRQRVWTSFDGRLLTGFFGLLVLWVAGVALRSLLRRRRVNPLRVRAPAGVHQRTLAFYARWLHHCAAVGHRRSRHQTPREFLATLPAELRDEGRELTLRFEALRYQ